MPKNGRRPKKKVPNYMAKLLEALETRPLNPGHFYLTAVNHDSWCDQLNGRGPCNCEPELEFVEVETPNVN